MPPTIYDVARKAKVSVATVSRVLNNKGGVGKETQQLILDLINELNYVPRTIINKRNNISILVPPRTHFFSSYFISDVLSGVSDVFFNASYNLVFLPIDSPTIDHFELIRALKSEHSVGAIFLYSIIRYNHILKLAEQGFPHVVIGSSFDEKQINWVDSDNIQGAMIGVNHLISYGHRRIGFIIPPLKYSAHADRLKGYKLALEEHGLEIDEKLILETEGTKSQDGYNSVMELLSMKKKPTAIFAGNDNIALGVYNCIQEMGMMIPDNISVIGFDDYEIVSYLNPPLTTIRQLRYELGKIAAEYLLESIKGNAEKPFHRKIKTRLIIRSSTMPIKEGEK